MALPFNVPDELKAMQVDPIHTANVLASMLGSIGSPQTDPTTGLPSVSNQGPTSNTAQPNTIADATTAGGTQAGATGATGAPASITPGQFPVVQAFGQNGEGGVDLGTPAGTPIMAMFPGTVTFAGPDEGFGHMVIVDHGGGIQTVYGHLQGDFKVKVGDQVAAGQQLDVVGAGIQGHSTGPHVEVQVQINGQKVDPAPYLAGAAPVTGTPAAQSATGEATAPAPLDPQKILAAQLANVVDTIGGNAPTHDVSQQATQPTTDTTPGGGTPNTPGTPGAASGSWATDILEGIGAPTTPENLALMETWMAHEGGAVHNNPLNTTLDAPGATNWNSIGVKTYTNYEQGLTSTIRTLLQSNMAGIVQAFRSGNTSAARAAITSSPWGTKNL